MWRRDVSWECVALRGVTVRVRVGLHAFERQRPQRVAVDVETYRQHAGGRRHDLAACLDYDRLYRHLVEDWPARPHTELLEDLAEDLVAFCLGDPRVEACRVVVRKLDIYAGQGVPEVQLYRRRAGSA
jgi:dihydroneopterin aldolase